MSFWLYGVLICLCLVTITGCVFPANPDTQNLGFYEDAALPNITLTRRVVPEIGLEHRKFQSKSEYVEVESTSRFGDPDEEPDLSCIQAGLREALPSIDIIPTATFWELLDAPQNTVELTELFATPQSDRLRALQANVLVIAYHARIDEESNKGEYLIGGGISDTEKETASVVVVDLRRSTIIHGSRITFTDGITVGHTAFVLPFAFVATSPSDICKTVAEQAGRTITLKMPDRAIRALVVVALEEPVERINQDIAKAKREKREAEEKRKVEEKRKLLVKLEQEANKGNTDAQLKIFKEIRRQDTYRALGWLCESADSGNQEAREILADIFQYAGYIWVKKGIVKHNYKLAYMWRGLSGKYDQEEQQVFANQYLTTAELSEAKKMFEDWQPGNCERELGLTSNN